MINPLKTQSIKQFLERSTHPDLATMYNADMECQVNVAQDGGDRIEGEFEGRMWSGWTDGLGTTWKSFRIPIGANNDPHYTDTPMSFDLAAHAEGIGMTGWNWKRRVSQWVAFDFDAITGHSEKHTRVVDNLLEVQEAAAAIPWVTVRRSTSGNGLHLYVFLHDIPTANHTEHAALARAIQGEMSAISGFDFSSRVDTCGGNMWCWHRKMVGTQGLSLIKEGITLDRIPLNWRDHVNVITNKRRKIQVGPLDEKEMDAFEEVVGQFQHVPLDAGHRELINWIAENNYSGWWQPDHHIYTTHTATLARAHAALKLKGVYRTLSQGSEGPGDHNCWMIPDKRGAWTVKRYSQGVAEDVTWSQDGTGYTSCEFNCDPDLRTAANACEGVEVEKGGFQFETSEDGVKAAAMLGAKVELSGKYLYRKMSLKEHKDGRLVIEIDKQDDDNKNDLKGWLLEKSKWKRIYSVQARTPKSKDVGNYDDLVRHLVGGESDKDAGWVIRSDNRWRDEPLNHIYAVLTSLQLKPEVAKSVIGTAIQKCWTLVNRPFQPEYPGNRQWNRDGAQFTYTPSSDKDVLSHPTWTKLLNHCGKGLDIAVQNNGWAKANGVCTGGDYLKCWVAGLLQKPYESLPYLFMYGPQKSGKTTFHEALGMLFNKGYMRAETALTSSSSFNGELSGAILCVVEELDLAAKNNKQAYNRIKDWVTSTRIPIHTKGQTQYLALNTTHWIQCGNDYSYVPIFPGDTRVTMIFVDTVDPLDMVRKEDMMHMLKKEAPDFLAAMLKLDLPTADDRLTIPIIETDEKRQAEDLNLTAAEAFLKEMTYAIDGEWIKYSELWDAFMQFTDVSESQNWTKQKFAKFIPPHQPKGRNPKDGQWYVCNISFSPRHPDIPKKDRLIVKDQMIRSVDYVNNT